MTVEDCSHRPPCPGCPSFGDALGAVSAFGELAAFAQAHGAELSLLEGPAVGYRHRARLAVRGRAGTPKVGIFQAGSHRIADIPRCPVHHRRINATAEVVRAAIRSTGTEPYADVPHRGLVRYLQLSVHPQTEVVQLVVALNDEGPRAAQPLFDELIARLGQGLHSLAYSAQPARTNAILGPQTQVVHGPATLQLPFGGAVAHFPPAAFMQNNLPLYSRLVQRVHGWVPRGARVVEYHAGVGALGLGLAARGEHVAFNELSPASLQGLELGLAALPADARARTQVLPGDAAEHVSVLGDASTVIVDPPRKGLGPRLVAGLCEQPVEQLVYVSCGLQSFRREAATLVEAGGYRLAEVVAVDLFPFTGHIETLARFVRA